MKDPIHFTIPEALHGLRLDNALATLCRDYSRSQIQQWITQGQVLLNDQLVQNTRLPVKTDQQITLHPIIAEQTEAKPQNIPLDIVFEDEAMIVINKPAGLTVHPGAGQPDGTLMNALLYHDPALAKLPRAGIIHRLDKDTTGLMVIARTLTAHTALVKALQAREIKRHYQALVHKPMISGGTIEAPIGRHPKNRLKMAVHPMGKPAVTHYRIAERFQHHCLLDVQLETGRTHQIRVHMAHIQHAIVGDTTYGQAGRIPPGFSPEQRQYFQQFKRQALNACRLELQHPVSGELMHWEAELPEDFAQLLALLRESEGNI